MFAILRSIDQNKTMKEIDSLTLSRQTAESFSKLFEETDTLAIKFFGQDVVLLKKHIDEETDHEISLNVLLRKSKIQIKNQLQQVKSMKVVSGQYKNKSIIAYLTAA